MTQAQQSHGNTLLTFGAMLNAVVAVQTLLIPAAGIAGVILTVALACCFLASSITVASRKLFFAVFASSLISSLCCHGVVIVSHNIPEETLRLYPL